MKIDKVLILNELMAHKNFQTKAKFARFLDITPQNLSKWFERNTFDIDTIDNKFPEVSRTWLLTGEGEMLKNDCQSEISVNHQGKGVPYYDVDFIGGFDMVCNDQTPNPSCHINFPQYNSADFWVNVTGHSMEPEISHGDMVAIKELPEWNTHILFGEMYAIITTENRTIKYVRKSKQSDEFLRLIPVNLESFDEQDIPKSIILKVFKVLGSAKKIQ